MDSDRYFISCKLDQEPAIIAELTTFVPETSIILRSVDLEDNTVTMIVCLPTKSIYFILRDQGIEIEPYFEVKLC